VDEDYDQGYKNDTLSKDDNNKDHPIETDENYDNDKFEVSHATASHLASPVNKLNKQTGNFGGAQLNIGASSSLDSRQADSSNIILN